MANTNGTIEAWCIKAGKFLDDTFSWTHVDKDQYCIRYKDHEYTVTFDDLEQVAFDLGIFDKMYPSNVGKITKWDELIKPIEPQTFLVYNPVSEMWFLTVMGVTFVVSGEIAGKMMNAGIEYRKYQPK